MYIRIAICSAGARSKKARQAFGARPASCLKACRQLGMREYVYVSELKNKFPTMAKMCNSYARFCGFGKATALRFDGKEEYIRGRKIFCRNGYIEYIPISVEIRIGALMSYVERYRPQYLRRFISELTLLLAFKK